MAAAGKEVHYIFGAHTGPEPRGQRPKLPVPPHIETPYEEDPKSDLEEDKKASQKPGPAKAVAESAAFGACSPFLRDILLDRSVAP